MKRRTVLLIVALIIAVAGAGFGGFLIGRNAADARYQAERALNVLLNKSDLDGLGEIEGPIYVTGHRNPDSDTVGSSIAYAKLLQMLGYDARAVVLGDINHETAYILDAAGMEAPERLEDASGCNMILVDHSEYEQSAEGMQDAHILSIIDHHGDGSVRTGNQLIYDARPLGATATIVWLRYRNYGLEPDPQTAYVMLGSIFSDTHALQYADATFADREAVKALSALAGVSDLDALWQGMHKAALSYEGMTDEEIFFSDYKEYECAGTRYGIGCMKAFDRETAEDMARRMTAVMPQALASTEMDWAFAEISVNEEDVSCTYLVPSNDVAKEAIEAAFGDRAETDGTSFVIQPSVSRKSVVVPAITDVLNAHPKD